MKKRMDVIAITTTIQIRQGGRQEGHLEKGRREIPLTLTTAGSDSPKRLMRSTIAGDKVLLLYMSLELVVGVLHGTLVKPTD